MRPIRPKTACRLYDDWQPMHRILRLLAACLCFAWGAAPILLHAAPGPKDSRKHPSQETGFLNRRIQIGTNWYRYQVYVPEDWHRDNHKLWPVILFLHGRGERGSEGMWQTQIGLPEAIRDHPERWPFIVVMPQCSIDRYWTDKDMLAMAMAELDEETTEFQGDPARTYLSGLSHGWVRRVGACASTSHALGGDRHCGWRHLLELRAGALGSKPRRCPANMRRPWDTRRSGCFMAPTTTSWLPGRTNCCTRP